MTRWSVCTANCRIDYQNAITISSNAHIKYIAHLDVDGSKESLILSLELFLVKNLNCEDTLVGDGSMVMCPKAQNVRSTIHG